MYDSHLPFSLGTIIILILVSIFNYFISTQSEIQRKAEMVVREQVLQGFQEQRALVDALTNVSIPLQLNQLSLKSSITYLIIRVRTGPGILF